MKILVLGGAGFLGSAVVKRLRERGYEVHSIARQGTADHTACDLALPNQVFSVLDLFKPNVVVNCAATADFTTEDISELYPVNIQLPCIVASWCKLNKSYFCHVSGTLVQGISTTYIDQNTPTRIDCEYAKSKWLAEELILSSGVMASILRFGGIFGARGPSHLGLNRAIQSAKNGHIPHVYASGAAKRNYIHVIDAAGVILESVEKQITGIRWCAGKEVLSIKEMMKSVCEVFCNGEEPIYQQGNEAENQVISVSSDLDMGMDFLTALRREQQ